MSILDHFSLPYQGLKDGIHEYHFNAGDSYFAAFEASPIKIGQVNIDLKLDKRTNNMSILDFEIVGYVKAACDRCLADILLPIKGNYQLHVKQGAGNNAEDDVIYLAPDEPMLKLAEVIYELIVLSMPMINRYDCETDNPKPCNIDVLNKLNEETDLPDESPEKGNSIWDNLKNIDLN